MCSCCLIPASRVTSCGTNVNKNWGVAVNGVFNRGLIAAKFGGFKNVSGTENIAISMLKVGTSVVAICLLYNLYQVFQKGRIKGSSNSINRNFIAKCRFCFCRSTHFQSCVFLIVF